MGCENVETEMLKMIARCLVVLLVGCVVAFAMYWVVQNNPSIAGMGAPIGEGRRGGFAGEGGFAGGGNFGGAIRGEAPAGGDLPTALSETILPEGGHDGDGELGILAGLVGVLRNIVVIAGITVAVVVVQRVSRLIFRRRNASST